MRSEVVVYLKYVRKQWGSWDDCNKCHGLTNLLYTVLTMADLDGVEFCHNDMTVENILLDKGQVFFIDPGVSRGLDCREQDESKILQSTLTQWEHLTRPSEFTHWTEPEPFVVTPAHLALLACHWMRIGAHFEKHSKAVQTAAPHIIKAIRDGLRCKSDDECGLVGHRRGLDRLRERCLSIVQDSLQSEGARTS